MTLRHLCRFMAVKALIAMATGAALWAGPLRNHPVSLSQPDGTVIQCLVSGDEYFNWIHDRNGYTIILDISTGYYAYALRSKDVLVPSKYIVGRVDPASVGLEKNALPPPAKIKALMTAYPLKPEMATEQVPNASSKGAINALIAFVRFSDDSEFDRPISYWDAMVNSSASSVYSWFKEASYNQLAITTSFYPPPNGSYVVSYQDSRPRAYYLPYSATNTLGYANDQRAEREQTLVASVIRAIAPRVPPSLNIDTNGDGFVDSITLIVKGQPATPLLWGHAWVLYASNESINQKKVYPYVLTPETPLILEGNATLCHETLHLIGAPDLYHYVDNSIYPVERWDPLGGGTNPPVHVSAFTKFRYLKWIASIPVIGTSGYYALSPLTSSTNNAFRINSPNSSSEYFMVEFRKKNSVFENSLPGEGILVYRINSAVDGTGNGNGPPDEVYIYRPFGTPSATGNVLNANFSADVGRRAINDSTNPSSFLSDGRAGGLNISNISAVGNVISFMLGDWRPATGTLRGAIDAPANNSIATGNLDISGWAGVFSGNAANQPARIELLVDGTPAGTLTPGMLRTDLQTYFAGQGITAVPNLGYYGVWDSRRVSDGSHILIVRAADAAGLAREALSEIGRVTIYTSNGIAPTTTGSTSTTTTTSSTLPRRSNCDIDGNGSVNIQDLQVLINMILNGLGGGDINGDGFTNIVDVQIFVNVLLSVTPCPTATSASTTSSSSTSTTVASTTSSTSTTTTQRPTTTTSTTTTTTTLVPPPQCSLFSDDFNDGDLAGWRIDGGVWQVVNGELQVSQLNPAEIVQITHNLPVSQSFRITMDVKADGFSAVSNAFYGFVTWASTQTFDFQNRIVSGLGAALIPQGLVGFLSNDVYQSYFVVDPPSPQNYGSVTNIGLEWSRTSVKLLVNGVARQTISANISDLRLDRIWLAARGPSGAKIRFDNICQNALPAAAILEDTPLSLRNLSYVLRSAPRR